MADTTTNALASDMKHVLEWLAIGLACMAIANVIHGVQDIARHDWIGLGFDALFAAVFVAALVGTIKRGRKYGEANR